MSEGFSIRGVKLNAVQKWLLVLAAVSIVLVVTAVVKFGGLRRPNLLASLPRPEENAPLVIITASEGGFPSAIFGMLADSATISPGGASPISLFTPVIADASQSALVVTEQGYGLSVYGAFTLKSDEMAQLAKGALPPAWAEHFVMPETAMDEDGVLRVNSLSASSPLFIELSGNVAYVADAKSNISRIRDVRAKTIGGIDHEWRVETSWESHIFINDGGVSGAITSGAEDVSERENPLSLEVAWRSPGSSQGNGEPSTEARWQLWGLENYIDDAFSASLKKFDWSGRDYFMPSPLIAAIGVNLPDPGKNVRTDRIFPSAIKTIAGHLGQIGLKTSETQNILTGPAVLSLGGRTQVLWFELPGITIDISGRGKTATKLVEHFWSETFMGAAPKPVPGFSAGGATDLPFSILAAANDDRAVIGLTAPDVEMDTNVKSLLERENSAIGWIYVNLPRLGASLSEMSSVNALLYEDADSGGGWNEDGTASSERRGAETLQQALGNLGSVLVLCDAPYKGRAYWY
ncbi:MAG: hypothetical protein LBS45_07605 [Synergistaceae bacterium]|nr:hypothetical protein [Synergistaceae bacterium]